VFDKKQAEAAAELLLTRQHSEQLAEAFGRRTRNYRHGRIAWWLSLTALLATLYFGRVEFIAAAFLLQSIVSVVVSYLPCPYCGAAVGRIGGVFLSPFLLPFGGWCVACGKRLFLPSPRNST